MVTGAAGSLGQRVAEAFEHAGARLVLVDRAPDRLQRLFPKLANSPNHFLAQSVDITNASAVANMARQTLERLGRIDILVNTAGGYQAGMPLHETPLEVWDSLFNLNAKSVFLVSRACIPTMLEHGSGKIINIASRAALAGAAGASVYSASKAVVVRLTESMAAELKNSGINVNCVLPGIIDTPANRQAMPDADHSGWVTTTFIANVILFLASDHARAISGAALPVFGRS